VIVLGGSHYLSVFNVEQLQALALMFLNLRAQGLNVSMVFLGFFCLLLGYLIFRSTFFPRIIGVLLAIAGLCYLTNYLVTFLSPVCRPSLPLHTYTRRGGSSAGPVAPRDRRERSTMEGTGQRRRRTLMKAAVYTRYARPEVVVQIADVEKPVPKDNEVLIKVCAASVNPLDGGLLEGRPYSARIMTGLSRPKITRLGVDVAGQVEAVGGNVTLFKPGDEVSATRKIRVSRSGCARGPLPSMRALPSRPWS
jgi:hypothetical protein